MISRKIKVWIRDKLLVQYDPHYNNSFDFISAAENGIFSSRESFTAAMISSISGLRGFAS